MVLGAGQCNCGNLPLRLGWKFLYHSRSYQVNSFVFAVNFFNFDVYFRSGCKNIAGVFNLLAARQLGICSRPSTPSSNVMKAPKSVRRDTFPLCTFPSVYFLTTSFHGSGSVSLQDKEMRLFSQSRLIIWPQRIARRVKSFDVFDSSPGHFRNRQQSLNAADINKCSEVAYAGNHTAHGHPFFSESLRTFIFPVHFFENRTAGQDYISPVFSIFDNDKIQFLADISSYIVNFFSYPFASMDKSRWRWRLF